MEEKSIELLTRLGLSITEAKIFVALHKNDSVTAKSISKSLNISRELVYITLPRLQEKGLVERIISNPQTFRRVSVKEACVIMLHDKKEEDKELSKLIKELPKDEDNVEPCKGEENISIIPTNSEDTYWLYRWKNVEKEVNIILSQKNLINWFHSTAEEFISIGNNRKINIRLIVITNLEKRKIEQTIRSFKFINLNFMEYRISSDISIPNFVIFDKKNLIICIKNDYEPRKAKWLSTNNPVLLEAFNRGFKENWQKLQE